MEKIIPILVLRPSGGPKWMTCAASPLLERDEPDSSSEYADEGTAAHYLAATCLAKGVDTEAYIFHSIVVEEGKDERFVAPTEPLPNRTKKTSVWLVDDEMASHIQAYINYCRQYADCADAMLVEQRIDFSEAVGLPGSKGTADCVIIDGETLHVIDLKYGQGVPVHAEHNEQLLIYALGAVAEHGMLQDFKRVMLHIYQPRIDNISTWECSMTELDAFAAKAKAQVQKISDIWETGVVGPADFAPSEKACKWCKAKPCAAMDAAVASAIEDEFTDLDAVDLKQAAAEVAHASNDRLARSKSKVPLVQMWVKAVDARTYSELQAGHEVPGYKLVEGGKGNRAWLDEAQVEGMLKTMRLQPEEMYDFKLISPTTAEKLATQGEKPVIGPRQWKKLQAAIVRANREPKVVPISDKRKALDVTLIEEEFDDLTDEHKSQGFYQNAVIDSGDDLL